MTYTEWRKIYIDKTTETLEQWLKEKETRFDIQRFNGQRIPEGDYNLLIRRQVQNRHIEGTREYQDYVARKAGTPFKPSKMPQGTNAQLLVNEFHGKGIYTPNTADNSTRETVDTGRIIGQYWNHRLQKFIDTSWIMIVYAKSGTHVYPIRPLETNDNEINR